MSEKKRDRDDRETTEQDEERSPYMEDETKDRKGEKEEFEGAGLGREQSPSNPPRKKK